MEGRAARAEFYSLAGKNAISNYSTQWLVEAGYLILIAKNRLILKLINSFILPLLIICSGQHQKVNQFRLSIKSFYSFCG